MPSQTESIAKIVEGDRQKGYGFLRVGKQRDFLRKNNFVERHKKPDVGDAIRFVMGTAKFLPGIFYFKSTRISSFEL